MVAKAGLGLIGLSAISVGGVALAKPGLLGMMPHYTKLSEDHNFMNGNNVSGDYSSKFGETYKDKLVGVVGTNKAENEKSSVEDWWEWSFKKLTQAGINAGKFKHVTGRSDNAVTKAYAKDTTNVTDGSKALNQVCKEAYKAEKTKVKANPGASETDFFDEVHVWKYCSWLGEKPKQETTDVSGA